MPEQTQQGARPVLQFCQRNLQSSPSTPLGGTEKKGKTFIKNGLRTKLVIRS